MNSVGEDRIPQSGMKRVRSDKVDGLFEELDQLGFETDELEHPDWLTELNEKIDVTPVV